MVKYRQIFLQKASSQKFQICSKYVSDYRRWILSVSFIISYTLNQSSSEVVVHKCPLKQKFLKISQYSQKNTCVGVFLKQSCRLISLQIYEKILQYKYFSINIAKFLRTAFFIEHLRWLLFKAMFETYQNFTKKDEKGFY